MAETVFNWDIQALTQLRGELQKLHDVLSDNKGLLTQEGFELMSSWRGKSGAKLMVVTAASAEELDKLVQKYGELIERLDKIISSCYEPCENEIISKVKQLL